MTRVLYWNINNFTDRKVFRAAPPAAAAEAAARLNHIINEVIVPSAPQIVVIVEVFDRTREVGYQGVPIRSGAGAGAGVLRLLNQLRAIDNRWCCVPPLNVGDFGFREAVAVLFNAGSLYFEGPYCYCLPTPNSFNRGRPPNIVNVGNLVAYSPAWRNALPSPANPTVALQRNHTWDDGNGPVPEVNSAAQWEFYAGGARLEWPGSQNRSPYHTRFREVAGAGRVLKLFAIHTSPTTAASATNRITQIAELPPAANEVSLVIGDFNVDSFGRRRWSYFLLRTTYTMLFSARDPATGNLDPARKPYLMTHLLPPTQTHAGVVTQVATPFNATGWAAPDPQHNVQPRYGYMGSIVRRAVSDSGAIDNAFVGYGPGLAAPAHNQTIVNPVVGKPYAGAADPVLNGGLPSPQRLAQAIPVGGVNPPPAPAPQVDHINFTQWGNLGRIYSTSDHLALVVDV